MSIRNLTCTVKLYFLLFQASEIATHKSLVTEVSYSCLFRYLESPERMVCSPTSLSNMWIIVAPFLYEIVSNIDSISLGSEIEDLFSFIQDSLISKVESNLIPTSKYFPNHCSTFFVWNCVKHLTRILWNCKQNVYLYLSKVTVWVIEERTFWH